MDSFYIKKNIELGRYAIAQRNLKAGELFAEEYPFSIGPKPSTCCCLECFVPICATISGSRCDICTWPLCGPCKKLGTDTYIHKRECEIFRVKNCKFYNLKKASDTCVQLDCIMPLRVLLKKESDPVRWEKFVWPMEHHRDKRFGSETWKADEQNVVKYLLNGPCAFAQRSGIDEELIQRVIGILEVNSFEGKTVNGDSIRCLFPKLAILSHSCTPNVTHSIHPTKGFK